MQKNKRIFTEQELEKRYENLLIMVSILEELNIEYFLSDGALLGIYRDKSFIPWDNDVDISVKAEDFKDKISILKNRLLEKGFVLIGFENSDKRCFLSTKKDNSKFEITAFFKKNGYRLSVLDKNEMGFKLLEKFFRKNKIMFKGVEFCTFSYIEEYLKFQYGDWKTPKQNDYFTIKVRTNYFNPFVRLKYQFKKLLKRVKK
jgi:phosphorylcholine metabolism protein LicD